jgi:hypothetical protein
MVIGRSDKRVFCPGQAKSAIRLTKIAIRHGCGLTIFGIIRPVPGFGTWHGICSPVKSQYFRDPCHGYAIFWRFVESAIAAHFYVTVHRSFPAVRASGCSLLQLLSCHTEILCHNTANEEIAAGQK